MEALAKPLRRQLENVVVEARDTAETAAQAALMQHGVGEADPPRHLMSARRCAPYTGGCGPGSATSATSCARMAARAATA